MLERHARERELTRLNYQQIPKTVANNISRFQEEIKVHDKESECRYKSY